MHITLFSGPDCSLCEDAKELIYPFLGTKSSAADGITIEMSIVDVTNSLALKKAYGLRIPVLRRDSDGKELDWPFTSKQLAKLLSGESL